MKFLNFVVVGVARWRIQTACISEYEIDILTCKNHHRHQDCFPIHTLYFRLPTFHHYELRWRVDVRQCRHCHHWFERRRKRDGSRWAGNIKGAI